MALVKTLSGSKLLIQIGDGADPEVFAHDCMINTSRSFGVAKSVNSFAVIDCDNPDDPAWVELVADQLSSEVSGAGMLHTSSIGTWFGYATSKEPVNVRILLNGVALADGGLHFAGQYQVTALEVTGNRGDKVEVSVSLSSNGPVTKVDASA